MVPDTETPAIVLKTEKEYRVEGDRPCGHYGYKPHVLLANGRIGMAIYEKISIVDPDTPSGWRNIRDRRKPLLVRTQRPTLYDLRTAQRAAFRWSGRLTPVGCNPATDEEKAAFDHLLAMMIMIVQQWAYEYAELLSRYPLNPFEALPPESTLYA